METKFYLKLLVVLLVFDFIWLIFFIGKPFIKMTEEIQGKKVKFKLLGALIAYTSLFVLAALILEKNTSSLNAFLIGASIYAVYDGINYALFDIWDIKIMIFDILCGGTLFYLFKRILY